MDKWKSRGGKSQRREEKTISEKRKSEKKKTQVRENVAKLRNTLFFPMFCGFEGRKVGSLKRRVQGHVDR